MGWLEFLKTEWKALSAAPLSFVGLASLGFVAGYGASKIIADRHIEVLKERIAAKDERLEDFKQRLSLVPTTGRKFEALTHADLQAKVLQLVLRLRAFQRRYDEMYRQAEDLRGAAVAAAKDRGDFAEARRLFLQRSSDVTRRMIEEYDRLFKTDAILLRDEMDARIPIRLKDRLMGDYEHPTNSIGVGVVIDDLEVRAKSLL